MGSEFMLTNLSTHAEDQEYDKYKKVAVQWRGSEAWEVNPRRPVFPGEYRPGRRLIAGAAEYKGASGVKPTPQEKQAKYSQMEQNTAQDFEAAVGTGEGGVTLFGNTDILADAILANGNGAGAGAGAGGGGGGVGADPGLNGLGLLDNGDWMKWALGAGAIGALALFLMSRKDKG